MTAVLTRARHTRPGLVEDRSAGFDAVTVRTWVNGPGSFRFAITPADDRVPVTFRSVGQIAMAIYLSGRLLRDDLPTGRVAELAVAGVRAAGDGVVDAMAAQWRQCLPARYQICTGLAWRLVAVTRNPRAYPGQPQWQPQWREVVA